MICMKIDSVISAIGFIVESIIENIEQYEKIENDEAEESEPQAVEILYDEDGHPIQPQ